MNVNRGRVLNRSFFRFRSVPLAWRLLARDRVRFAVTVTGICFVVILMLFLSGVYVGVRTESNGYVAGRPADVWIAQNNTTNLIRSSSFLQASRADAFRTVPGVASIAPLLRLITTLSIRGQGVTAFVFGVEPNAAETYPNVVKGRGTLGKGDIVIDRALARRVGILVGDTIRVQGRSYRVTGISAGTNAIISQFTFIRLEDAQELLGFSGVVSFFLIRAAPGVSPELLADRLRSRVPLLNVFSSPVFIANNLEEMRTGLLPILATVAIFGVVVGVVVLTLLLYGTMLERREDYALLKAIGAGRGLLRLLVLRQSLVSVSCGFVFGLLGYFVAQPVVGRLVPVLALSLSPGSAAVIGGAALAMGGVGAWLPLTRLERIHPAEVFRA
jgi:putative ABC transport system permease protein